MRNKDLQYLRQNFYFDSDVRHWGDYIGQYGRRKTCWRDDEGEFMVTNQPIIRKDRRDDQE
jgi:hypothetical protein